MAIFGSLMTIFYLGVGIYLCFFAGILFNIDKFLRILLGSTFIFYGLYRAYRTYLQIKEAFFEKDEDTE